MKKNIITVIIILGFTAIGYFVPRLSWSGSKEQWEKYDGKTQEKTVSTIGGFILGLIIGMIYYTQQSK